MVCHLHFFVPIFSAELLSPVVLFNNFALSCSWQVSLVSIPTHEKCNNLYLAICQTVTIVGQSEFYMLVLELS